MNSERRSGHFDDAWQQVDKTDDPGFFVRFLDASRARALEFARKNPKLAFAHLELAPGMSVLDCGCGTGDMLTLMSGLTAPGEACGGDLSGAMLEQARRRAETAGAEHVRFEPMDVQSLPFPDRSYDRVLATQLLVHVPDPRGAMHEICRVTKPKGLVSVADTDWDTLVVGCSDKELGRRFTRLFSDGVRNGLVVRDYAGWLRHEGFTNVRIIPQPIVFDDWTFVKDWIVGPAIPHFVKQGSMSTEEAQTLVDDLAHRNANGEFFAAFSFYTVMGQRP
jgi:ubiquinone/menaquinone biosynthesis C-methylase UbiE